MTSQNNSIGSQRGSALIVTILLVSVLLVTALILLQRIIPYAKSVRSMHDASQAYYAARGEVDMARLEFFYSGSTSKMVMRIPTLFGFLSSPSSPITSGTPTPSTQQGNIFVTDNNIKQLEIVGNDGEKKAELKTPFSLRASKTNGRDHVVVSATPELPLKIKLFSTDTTIVNFGTSKINSLYHTLYSRNSGGLRFDLRGVKTDDMGTFKLKFPDSQPFTGTLTVKMQYYDADSATNTDVKTFTNEEFHNAASDVNLLTRTGNTQIIKSDGGVENTVLGDPKFSFFLDNNCAGATICSLTLALNSTTNQSIDFQLISDKQIPDLNAVVIGDGLSGNGLYYQRIIDLIPTPQDI